MLKPYTSGHLLLVVFYVFLSLLSGCAALGPSVTYEGERLPSEKVAIIKPTFNLWVWGNISVSVEFVDGKYLKDKRVCGGGICAVEMLPGKRLIGVRGFSTSTSFRAFPFNTTYVYVGTFEFDAKAGREYVLSASMAQDQPLILLKDKATNEVVGQTVASKEISWRNVPPGKVNVPPGKVYAGKILNITAPKSEGWQLLNSSSSGMSFARKGNAPGETFAAAVAIFDLPQTDSPEEFEAFIVKGAQGDAETDRFSTSKFTHQFTAARGYPCVQMQNISEDRQAKTGSNKTETLVLQNEHLYCRHPVQKNIGFVITYSHRGTNLHPDFQNEAHSFIEGVLVPSNPPSSK